MYWPLGAPRIYAASHKPRRKSSSGQQDTVDEDRTDIDDGLLADLQISRSGHLFATITHTTLAIWQTTPVAVLASVVRSPQSLKAYGSNVSVLLRPDSSIAVVQTQLSHLITYTISVDSNTRVYKLIQERGQTFRQNATNYFEPEEAKTGFPQANIRFRKVIKIDAGISKALALDEELVVATEKPAAVQCIRWTPDNDGSQYSTELLSRMAWIQKKSIVIDLFYDRAMSLAVWISNDGRAHAVQRLRKATKEMDTSRGLFQGYNFHSPVQIQDTATQAAINARFSVIAVACASGEIYVYNAKDYVGSIPLSHIIQPPASLSTTGSITSLSYSPDGYCLFAGFERGWALWSVYGKAGATSFTAERKQSELNSEGWLLGILKAAWVRGGSGIMLASQLDDRLWIMEVAKSAVTTCFSAANVSRTVLITTSGLMIYCGYDLPYTTTVSPDPTLWHHVQVPAAYAAHHLPLRCVVISSDGRYVAIAGRRGLAHYSVMSGRWKTFNDVQMENSFVVRGGMCWYQHILIAAVETDECHELRLYSREYNLDDASLVYTERLSSTAVVISLSGQDSLLVYTYENVLYHYVINASSAAVTLVQVGQIALNGIVRAPARVRAVCWILPDHQLFDGDPSQDVKYASVIFLVDAKLVILQPSTAQGELKYDMRIVAHQVEYFDFIRNRGSPFGSPSKTPSRSPSQSLLANASTTDFYTNHSLQDSLWYFDGSQIHCWMDVTDLMQSLHSDDAGQLLPTVTIATDFYPSSIVIKKGVISGVESELSQRRDIPFALFRLDIRTQLFLPQVLHRQILISDQTAALFLSHRYRFLPYFSHALEILLHTVLDDEVDSPPEPASSLLPSVLSFLSSFPSYLDILVQCTRKTEVRSWRTLFAHLPPPQDLFEASLEKDMLKTAGGYLLVLQTFDKEGNGSEQCVKLMQMAKEKGDWDLCKELVRFLMALDETGNELRQAVEKMGVTLADFSPSSVPVAGHTNAQIESQVTERDSRFNTPGSSMQEQPIVYAGESSGDHEDVSPKSSSKGEFGLGIQNGVEYTEKREEDYFSQKRGK